MKVKIVKKHHVYSLGEHELKDQQAEYLIRMGVAEKVKAKKKDK